MGPEEAIIAAALIAKAPELIEKLTPLIKEVVNKIVETGGLLPHILEHEAVGSARIIDPVKAKDPSIPCTCFDYEGDSYCWKPGYLGLISSKRNTEQMATCVIREPGGEGAQKRFGELKGVIAKAHVEWEKKGGDLKEWWSTVAEKLEEKGVEL